MTSPTSDFAMYQTMHHQPDDVRRLLAEGQVPVRQAADRLAGVNRIFLAGIGTSYHAALVGSWLLRAAGVDARALLSFDMALYREAVDLRPSDGVIILAHTGVKRFSAEAMARARDAGATVISIGSLSAEHTGSQLVLRTVAREKSAAYTASHLAAMTVLAQLAIALGARRGAQTMAGYAAALERLPEQIADVLAREEEVVPVAREAIGRQIYAAGAGPNEATALEAMIKVREAAYGHIDALALEQFLHGPIVTVNGGDLAVLITVPGVAAARMAEIAVALKTMGAMLWLVGQGIDAVPDATVFALPALPELLSPLLAVVPMQILAYQMARLSGANPDVFRRDNPTYQAALSLHL